MSLADLLRRCVPGAIKRPLKRALGLPQTRLHGDWAILAPIGPVDAPHVVIDAGAHAGWFFHCWLDWCPQGRVHAFEPYPESFRKMQGLYGDDPRVTLNAAALGDQPGELPLQVMAESKVSNSFLSPQQETWDAVGFRTGDISRVQVPVDTIDAYCARQGIDRVFLLKVDVQGFELKLLQGARATLPRIDHVLVESAIQPLYAGAARFTQVADFMQEAGFHLMASRAWHRGNHVLMETDMLFRRNGLEPAVDEQLDRVMEQ